MIDICGLLLKILKSSTPGLLESGTTKIRQGGDGNGLAEVSALSRRRRFVNRPAGRPVGPLVVLAALVVWVGAQPASGQTDDDNVRMIPLAAQVEVPPEIGAVDVEVVALGSEGVEVEAGGKSSVLIASDADGTLMLAAANEDGGYLGEGPGAVELGIESTAITLVAVASGRRFGEIDPELAQAIRSHEEFGRLTRLLEALMASDKNYLDRLYSYPQAVTLIKSVAAGVASVGPEPSVEAGPGFKQLQGRDVAKALAAAEDIAAYNSETGPIGRLYKDDFYCVPGSGYSFGILPCSAWKDREPWHWYGNALGLRALFPDKWYEWLPVVFGSGYAFPRKYAKLVWREAGTPPFLAVSDDTMNGCRSFDFSCKEDGVHATANPNFVSYAMELYEDGVYQDWFYTAGNGTMYAKLRDSGAAYREFRAGPRRTRSPPVLLSPEIDQVRFQRYRFSFAEGDEAGLDRGAVVSFMNTLHFVISLVNLVTDLSEVRGVLLNADVVEQAPTILACSEEVVKALATTVPDLIVNGKFAPDINPEKEDSTLILESLRDLAPAFLKGLRTPACGKLLGLTVKGGVSDRVLREAISSIDDLLGPPATRQSLKIGADFALAWIKLAYDAVNDTIPVAVAYFRPAGDRVDYHLFWDENRNGTPYISSVSKSRPPTAHFTYRQKGGFKVELDASETEPGDSDDLAYTWRVNGARVGGNRERFVHDFGAAGRYDVELVVIDANRLTGKFSYGVDVIPGTPPEVSSLECTPTRYDTFRMVASFSDEDGDIETVEWRSNVGSLEPDRVTSAGTTQVELRASGSTTWASVIVEDAAGNRGSRVCSVNLEYVPTATLGIDSLSAACGREEPWRACYHRLGMNQGELFEFSVSMPREPTGTWHVAWCAKEEREGLCRGQHDWTTRIDKRFSNEAPLTFPMTPPAGVETFWVVAEVRECNKSLCSWPEDFTEVEFHHIEVSVLRTDGGTGGETRVFDGVEFVWVPAGEFQMGSTSSESQSDERPVTQVRISRGFWMGKYEVTQAQWEAVMGSNPSHFTNCGGDCPVEAVSWEDVQEFIGKLNARSGGRPYRLPTEAEWEYAARAGTTEDRYGDLDEIAWYGSNSRSTTHPVGEKAANAWGLHDMLGNVWEWVQDWSGSYPGGSVTAPTGPGSGSYRVLRGGSWYGGAGRCRSAVRGLGSPGNRGSYLGFRLLREGGTGGGGGNRAPELHRALPGLTLQVGGSADTVTLGDHFRDPEGDELSYTTVTMPAGVVNVTRPRDSDVLTFEPVSAGTARVTVTATDPGRLFTRGTIDVTVNPATTTEDPNPGETRTFDGVEFVWVPAGQFQMGSTSSESFSDERPVTQVRISRGFWMGKYEVTQRQWEAVMGSNPSRFKNCGGDCPVEEVSWEDVQEFIGKLNARSGGRPYRLPTEAEWEYAARAGTTEDRYGDLDEIAWYRSNSGRTPHLVGQKAANAWGLHDMLGNVWEWVQDWYGSYPGGSVTDPTGPGSGSDRVRRGGGWINHARNCRSAYRGRDSPGYRFNILGFRLLRDGGTGGGGGNRAPELHRALPGLTLQVGGSAETVALGDHFRDPDGDELSYTTVTMPAGVVNVTRPRDSDVLTFEPVSAGTARVTVTATDPGRLFTRGTIDVTVNPATTTEEPNPGETRTFDGIEFTWIPPGQFQMGSTSSESFSGERPVTQVRISRGFWMGKYEVTQRQWEAVMGSNPSRFKNCGGDCPVEQVSWHDVQDFVATLNGSSRGEKYRLPTEAEWEYAARAGTTEDRYGDLDEIAWYGSNSGSTTHPVGEKAANAWGLHDMLGNVWEGVQDWHGSYPGGSVTDPTGPESGSKRVRRGGSWGNIARHCRSANRHVRSSYAQDDNRGFRLLRDGGTGEDDDDDDETGQGVLFSEDFESYAAGSRPSGYEFVMGLTGRGAGEQRVESDGGNQYLRMAGRAGPNNEAVLAKFFDFDVPNVVSVSWRMRVDNDINSYLFRDPDGVRTAVFGAFAIKTEDDPFGAILISKNQSDRKIVAWCPSGSGSRPEVGLGVWSEYRWEIDFAASRYTAYKDGERFCSAPFPLGNLVSSAGIGFLSGDTVMRFDDIVIRGESGSGGGTGGGGGGSGGNSAGDPMMFDGIEFVWVPPGEFQMGSTSQHAGRDEKPVTRVRLTQGFWMGKYEVTQAQWQEVMKNPGELVEVIECADCPVLEVSWEEVQEFIKRLNARPGGGKYRLPTEAEWEYAARAGTTTDTYVGDITQPEGNDPVLNAIAWYRENSGSELHPVGRKAPNGWGLYDMLGNVWEWVADWYVQSYPGGSVTDPAGPRSGTHRVVRGGSWFSYARICRSARRSGDLPGNRVNTLGFRLARKE